jgi:5-methylcytosine-specific restriction endonuclease McrA
LIRVPFTCPACGSTADIPRNKLSERRYCTRRCATATFNSTHLVGPNNGRWRGGRALNYGPGWKQIKARIRERDRVCRRCGKTPAQNGRALDVHHLDPFRFSGDHSDDNLVALCRSCHMRADDHGRAGSARFLSEHAVPKPPTKRETRHAAAVARAAARARARRRAAELHTSGWSLRAIALSFGVSHQTVVNWISTDP